MRGLVLRVAVVVLGGCTSIPTGTANHQRIVGEYKFSENSRYTGRPFKVIREGGDVFVILEGAKFRLYEQADHCRFTTGDMVWNEDRTRKDPEWFTIAFDQERNHYFIGAPGNPKWRQYLDRQ
jgi:hypothetical protein